MKQNVIITCSNEKYGDFLVNQWYRSLKDSVNLANSDVVVMDYGLSQEHVDFLKRQGAIIVQGNKDGHIVTMRFVDAHKFLATTTYDQVLFVDGGDVVFQDDIAPLFEQNKDAFRVTKLDMEVLYFEAFIPKNFTGEFKSELWKVLKGKPVLNAGLIIAPKDKFVFLCKEIEKLVSRKDVYGPDQIIVNYVLHQDTVVLLDKKYNFMFGTEWEGFEIKEGIFYRKNGEKIAVAHNAGHDTFFRPIANFGYGKGYNKLKPGIYYPRKLVFSVFGVARFFTRLIST